MIMYILMYITKSPIRQTPWRLVRALRHSRLQISCRDVRAGYAAVLLRRRLAPDSNCGPSGTAPDLGAWRRQVHNDGVDVTGPKCYGVNPAVLLPGFSPQGQTVKSWGAAQVLGNP